MTRPKKGLADTLLDAHVEFVLEQLTGDALPGWLESTLDALLADATKIKLKDAVTTQMIKDTARTYAVELKFAGGLPELVGDIGRALHAHDIHKLTTFGDVLSDQRFSEIIDKVLEFKSLRSKIIRELFSGPLYGALASDLLVHGIQDYLSDNALVRNLPGAGSVMKFGKRVISKASMGMESTLEEGLKKSLGRSIEKSAQRSIDFLLNNVDDHALREMALDVWERLRDEPISALRDEISSLDQEELFVIGYEYFQELRVTQFFATLIESGIDSFFEKYGNSALSTLISDIGVTRDKMLAEAHRYGPPILRMLKRKKLLQPMVRRYLEPFYRSAAFERIASAAGS